MMIAYYNGSFFKKEDIRISPDDRGFLFADGLYEVVRSYKGHLFKIKEHLRRMNYGALHLKLAPTDFSFLEEVALELIRVNNLEQEEATVYFQVTRGAARRTHAFPVQDVELTLLGMVSKFDTGKCQKNMERGVSVITVPDIRWSRCDMKTTALTANILGSQAAVEKGATEALFVRDGVVLEGTHSNFFAVFGNTIVTAPLSNYILGGITRQCVVKLCRKEGLLVEERPIFEKDLHLADELMISGTTVEVTPVVQLDGIAVGDGKTGPVTRRAQAALLREVSGKK